MAGGERWNVVAINGEAAGDYSVIVQNGRIIGGFDDCTEWSFKTPESPIVVGDGAVCPPDENREAYWTIVNARRGDADWGESEMVLEAEGQQMAMRRPD